jgi:hypothetical protein
MSNHTSGIRVAKVLLALVLALTALVVAITMASRSGAEIGEDSTENRLSASDGDAPGQPANDGDLAQTPRRSSTPIDKVAVYDPQLPLSRQLERLRLQSDQGNPYATCVLAYALDLCAGGVERVMVDDMSRVASDDPDEHAVDRWATDLEFRSRFETTCTGMDEHAYADMEKRLLMSARLGHPGSMGKFAQMSLLLNLQADEARSAFARSHRNSAERMLNQAAEGGDLDALRGLHRAYSEGFITNAFEDVQVTKDSVKSAAALYALSQYASPEERLVMASEVEAMTGRMSSGEMMRFQRLSARYVAAAPRSPSRLGLVEAYPEVACADL